MSMKFAGRYNTGRYREDYVWDRCASEPNLSTVESRVNKFPHEYISVDDLKFFRRKQPPLNFADFHTKSSICLATKNEASHLLAVQTEYRRQYKDPKISQLKNKISRKPTTLKLEGCMDIISEHKSKYLAYPEDEVLRSRGSIARRLPNLKLCGELELEPEYKSSFISHPLSVRSTKIPPKETIKMKGLLGVCNKNTDMHTHHGSSTEASVKTDAQKCHLKLEGKMSCEPEYRSQFIQFPIEKSHSIPQLSNIKFQGDFDGVPEYTESFKFYDHYSKSAPIKKADHIQFNGKVDVVPEYREKFKGPNISNVEKTISLKTEDHLHADGEFTKALPEYHESYKDPHITCMPERGKCKEPYFRLKGKIEFNPEYRSTYLNHPRSRPIVKKSVSSLRLSNSTKSPFGTPKRRFKSTSPPKKYHDPNDDLPVACKPEYRKAMHDYQIRERHLTHKITDDDTKNNSKKTSLERKLKASPRRKDSPPKFKLNVDNVDDSGRKSFKCAPKYGRRSSISRNAQNIREKTGVIEGNRKYNKGSNKSSGESFLVLDEPCKKSSWVEKSWYEA